MKYHTPFSESENDIEVIQQFDSELHGTVYFDNRNLKAILERKEAVFFISIDEIIDLELDDTDFYFITESNTLIVKASLVAHRNSVQTVQKAISRYSEAKVYSFSTKGFIEDANVFFRAYYPTKHNRVIYDLFNLSYSVSLTINEVKFFLDYINGYIIIESAEKLAYETFSESCYNIMVALGFLSGKFIQTEVYIFQQEHSLAVSISNFKYKTLRPSSNSIYHALTHNPYGYKHMIGVEYAENLYNKRFLNPVDGGCFSKLVELIQNNSQVQYALVLFNEANDKGLSLLVKNNCFFAVLEVLRKYLYDRFRSQLPADYSQKGNIEKYKIIFEQLIQLGDDECRTLEKRNAFLHGDIKNIADEEMVIIMQKQITLIYRLLLTLTCFDGHIIDHYAIRNNMPEKAFIKVN